MDGVSIKTHDGKYIEDTNLRKKLLTMRKGETTSYKGATVTLNDIGRVNKRDYLYVRVDGLILTPRDEKSDTQTQAFKKE